jgi:ABC-type multidrug transport system fused ATPase/permease subunit
MPLGLSSGCVSVFGSIASNIRLGTPWITEEAIYRAAQT